MDIEEISRITELSKEEIQRLEEKIYNIKYRKTIKKY